MNTPVESVPQNESLLKRIAALEARYGKEFTEILVDLHDHVFGASPPLPEKPVETVGAPVENEPKD